MLSALNHQLSTINHSDCTTLHYLPLLCTNFALQRPNAPTLQRFHARACIIPPSPSQPAGLPCGALTPFVAFLRPRTFVQYVAKSCSRSHGYVVGRAKPGRITFSKSR